MAAKDAYLQFLVEGNVSLYVFRNVVSAISESRTVDHTVYYLMVDSSSYMVSMRRKSLLKTPGIDKDIMKGIFQSNRLKVRKNEVNFIRAVYLYNEALK